MKENRKRVFRDFRYMECGAFADYLRAMSMEGWHFISWKFGLIFEKGEPEDIAYAVEVFPKGRESDSQPGIDAKEYAEYCEAAGWRLIDGRRRFCIFRRVQDDAVPIVTEEERYQNVKKAEIRHLLDRSAGFALLAGLDWLQFLTINFDIWVFSQAWLLLLAGLTLMCLVYLLRFGGLLLWSRRAKRELESWGRIYYGQRKRIRAANEIWALVMLGLLIFYTGDVLGRGSIIILITAVIIIFAVRIAMIYMRPSWETQIAVWSVFSYFIVIILAASILTDTIQAGERDPDFPDVPLVQSDYREMEGGPAYLDHGHEESFLGNMDYYRVSYELGQTDENGEPVSDSLIYTIYRSRHPWILEKLWDDGYKSEDSVDCAASWQAERAVEAWKGSGDYLVMYDDMLLVLRSDMEMDDAQIQIVREKLGVI